MYRNYVGRRIHETLDAGPRTRRELFDALDADDATIESALDRLQERGVVVRDGSEFRLDSTETERLGRIRSALAGFGRRIARPMTLELDASDETDERDEQAPLRREVKTDANRREHAGGTDREHEPERERESTG